MPGGIKLQVCTKDNGKEGSFREDLFYRINLIHLHLPARSERPEDIPLLVEHFASQTQGAGDNFYG